MSEPMPAERRGPYAAPRAPRNYPTSKVALLTDHARDWVYARAQYEAGIKAAKLIADEIGVSMTSFFSRASNEGWTKNPEARAQYMTELKVAQDLKDSEKLAIERNRAERVNAEMQARVLIEHRKDVRRARTLTQALMEELEGLMGNEIPLRELGELMRDPDENGKDKLAAMYQKIIDLPSRVDINLKLSSALKNQILLERQAFGINGALEDPEKADVPQAGRSELDTILNKFDLVIKKKGTASPSSAPHILGEIIDVSAGG